MIALINGVEAAVLGLFKGGNASVKAVLLNDDGTDMDLTGLAAHFKVYATQDRASAPLLNKTGTLTTALGGLATFTLLAADMNFSGNTDGTPFYTFIEIDDASTPATYVSRQGSPTYIK